MADQRLSPDLIERVRARANDPERRSDTSSTLSHTVSVGSLLDRLGPKGEQLRSIENQLQGLMGQFAPGLGGLRVATGIPFGDPAGGHHPEPLPAPATAEQLAEAEKTLGRSLPSALKQLYAEVADGGFGPGGGLFPLARIAHEYDEMTREPAGPQNQPWPANLLPLVDAEPGYDCLDLDSGEMIAWDPEEIEGYSNAAWLRSFKPLAPNLAAWLEEWLGRPTVGERMADQQERMRDEGRKMAAQGMVNFFARKTPEERAAMGLPEVGWEEELLRRNGLL